MIKLILIAFVLLLIQSCEMGGNNPYSDKEITHNRGRKTEEFIPHSFKPSSSDCFYEQLSEQFNFRVFVHFYAEDTAMLRVSALDKRTNNLVDSISLSSGYLWSSMYANCKDVRSYVTGFNQDKQVVDNCPGTFIIADFNFDGLDDFAIGIDSGGNGGTVYAFYVQTKKRTFELDNYLTEEMERFPVSFDQKNKILMTSVHANVSQDCERVFQLSKSGWKEISKRFVP